MVELTFMFYHIYNENVEIWFEFISCCDIAKHKFILHSRLNVIDSQIIFSISTHQSIGILCILCEINFKFNEKCKLEENINEMYSRLNSILLADLVAAVIAILKP